MSVAFECSSVATRSYPSRPSGTTARCSAPSGTATESLCALQLSGAERGPRQTFFRGAGNPRRVFPLLHALLRVCGQAHVATGTHITREKWYWPKHGCFKPARLETTAVQARTVACHCDARQQAWSHHWILQLDKSRRPQLCNTDQLHQHSAVLERFLDVSVEYKICQTIPVQFLRSRPYFSPHQYVNMFSPHQYVNMDQVQRACPNALL